MKYIHNMAKEKHDSYKLQERKEPMEKGAVIIYCEVTFASL